VNENFCGLKVKENFMRLKRKAYIFTGTKKYIFNPKFNFQTVKYVQNIYPCRK